MFSKLIVHFAQDLVVPITVKIIEIIERVPKFVKKSKE